jgi:tetratricopeptide (TPR) repeat protein
MRPDHRFDRKPVPRRRDLIILLAILLLGLLLRVGYLAELRHAPDFAMPVIDAEFHDYWARGIAFGEWRPPAFEADPQIRTTPYFRPPGYPFFLAAVRRLVGHGYVVPRLVQMLIGILNAWLAYTLARRFISPTAGLAAALLMATAWPLIYFEGEFLDPFLTVTMLLLLMHVLASWYDRIDLRNTFGAGALLGLLALVRPNALLIAPAALIWALRLPSREGLRPRQKRLDPGSPLLRILPGFGLGIILVILPVTIRNAAVAHDFVPISSNAGINFYIGNNPRADGLVRGTMPEIGNFDNCFDHVQIVSNVSRILGRRVRHSEASSYLAGQAWRWIGSNPGQFIRLLGKKSLLFWGPAEASDNKEVSAERGTAAILRLNPIGFPLAVSLGVAGAGLMVLGRLRRKRGPGDNLADPSNAFLPLCAWVIAAWFLSHLPFAITSRYRIAIVPLLFIMGAAFIDRLGRMFREQSWRPIVIGIGAWAGLFALWHVDLSGYEPSLARWHYDRGIAFARAKRMDAACGEYRLALRYNDRYGAVYNDLGAALYSQGKTTESLPCFIKAIELRPADPSAHYNLAGIYEQLGDFANSKKQYEEALRLRPDHAPSRAGLARVSGPHRGQ